jgi:hypothetical protein
MNKKKEMQEIQKVTVTNYEQLVQAIEPFTKETTIKKLLIEGLDVAKRQAEYSKAPTGDQSSYGGFLPARPNVGGHYLWVDTLITKRLDGKRDGLKVTWKLPEGQYEFDPYSQKLKQTHGPDKASD